MSRQASPYYPPRAGWKIHFRSAGKAARRTIQKLYIERENVRLFASEWQFVGSLAIPGYAFVVTHFRIIGWTVLACWLAATFIFLAWLGYPLAEWAFAAMLSLHVSSILHIFNRATPDLGLIQRLVVSLAVLFLVGACLYTGLLRQLLVPLKIGEKVYVAYRLPNWATLHRGDVVAYHTWGSWGQVAIHSGYVLDRVLAAPGDKVEFTPDGCRVNGGAPVRGAHMPQSGSTVLPEKTWLIWPALSTVTRRNEISEEDIAKSVLGIAQVKRDQVIGKPFRRWFWREQKL